jgi:ABC-type Fe3+/spermidine/putrescine transport system ATPase subunit
MVFQDYALWPQVSVLANVVYALERLRLPRRLGEEVRVRVDPGGCFAYPVGGAG